MNLGDILWNLNWFKYKERLLETNKDLKCNKWQLSITKSFLEVQKYPFDPSWKESPFITQ